MHTQMGGGGGANLVRKKLEETKPKKDFKDDMVIILEESLYLLNVKRREFKAGKKAECEWAQLMSAAIL